MPGKGVSAYKQGMIEVSEPTYISRNQTSENEALSLSLLLRTLKQGRRRILACTIVALLLSSILCFLLKNTYTASASFIPAGSNTSASAAALMGQFSALAGAGIFGGRSQGDLYVGILKSSTIGRAMVDRFDLKQVYKVKKESDAAKQLLKNSSFEVGTKDPLVTVTVTENSPELARDLANGYLLALQDTSSRLAISESAQRRQFFEQRLAKERDDLANAEVALKQTQEKSGLIAPAGQTASEIQTLAGLNAQITERQVQLAALSVSETNENPDVIRLRSEITNLQGQLGQLQNGKARDGSGRISTSQVPQLELDYIRKTREVRYHEALFEIIAKQYEAARLDEAKEAPLQVLDRATTPDTKSGPHRTVVLAGGVVFGFFIGIVWVLWRAASRGTSSGA